MSWFSDAIDGLPGGKVINAIGGPIVSSAGKALGLGGGSSAPGVAPVGGGANPLLVAAGAANAANLGQKSSNFADLAGKSADAAWNAKAPLREAGIAGMLHPQHADLSGLAGQRMAGNPFAKPIAIGGASGPAPAPIAPPSGPPVNGPPPVALVRPAAGNFAPIPSGKSGQAIMPSDLTALMQMGDGSGLSKGAQLSAIQAYQELNPDYAELSF